MQVTQTEPFKIALAQTETPTDGNVVEQARNAISEAKELGAAIVAFPEFFMSPFELDAGEYAAAAQPIDGPFATAIGQLAAEAGVWVLFTMNEKNPADSTKPFNTAVLVDDCGRHRGSYRKTHLFDAGSPAESDRATPGDALFAPVATPFGKIGLGICYDLRFPEISRAAALAGCDLMLFPAGWVDGPTKADQWEALLRARALENEMHVVGICRAGKGYVGHSIAVAPNGRTIAQTTDNKPRVLIAEINPAATTAIRDAIPVFRHRRPELYV